VGHLLQPIRSLSRSVKGYSAPMENALKAPPWCCSLAGSGSRGGSGTSEHAPSLRQPRETREQRSARVGRLVRFRHASKALQRWRGGHRGDDGGGSHWDSDKPESRGGIEGPVGLPPCLSGTWSIDMPLRSEESSPVMEVGGFRFRLLAWRRGAGRGVYLQYLGPVGEGEEPFERYPVVRCSVAVGAKREQRWRGYDELCSQPLVFNNPTETVFGLDSFLSEEEMRRATGRLDLNFAVMVLGVHFPSRTDVLRLQAGAWKDAKERVAERFARSESMNEYA
jgi:hypothetical protein